MNLSNKLKCSLPAAIGAAQLDTDVMAELPPLKLEAARFHTDIHALLKTDGQKPDGINYLSG